MKFKAMIRRDADDPRRLFDCVRSADRLFTNQPGRQYCRCGKKHRFATLQSLGNFVHPAVNPSGSPITTAAPPLSTTQQGNKQSLVVGIPSAVMNPCYARLPNRHRRQLAMRVTFSGGAFLFDTEDGIIANWTGQANAVVAVDNSAAGAVYKGLALLTNNNGTFLLAANFNSGHDRRLRSQLQPDLSQRVVHRSQLPAGFAPHGIHIINNQIYVAYAQQDSAKHDPNVGAGLGSGRHLRHQRQFRQYLRFRRHAQRAVGRGRGPAFVRNFSNDILVGNFGDGTINAFDTTGKFLGQVTDSSSHVITNAGLWDMVYGAGGTGDPNTLYFTAGGASQTSGLFATPRAGLSAPPARTSPWRCRRKPSPSRRAVLRISRSARPQSADSTARSRSPARPYRV